MSLQLESETYYKGKLTLDNTVTFDVFCVYALPSGKIYNPLAGDLIQKTLYRIILVNTDLGLTCTITPRDLTKAKKESTYSKCVVIDQVEFYKEHINRIKELVKVKGVKIN